MPGVLKKRLKVRCKYLYTRRIQVLDEIDFWPKGVQPTRQQAGTLAAPKLMKKV